MTATITANKTFQYFDKVKWVELPKGSFADAEALGFPIRVLWKSGSFKVIKNVSALPKDTVTKRVFGKPVENAPKPKALKNVTTKKQPKAAPKVAPKPLASTDNAEIKALLIQLLKKLG